MIKGKIFEIVRGSCVDGPGIRTTVFLSGCNMRCKWCHNPESWCVTENIIEYTVDELFEKINRDKSYYGEKGGVTFSGGECLLQIDFLCEILKKCKEKGIHTAIDTAGNVNWSIFEKVIPFTDLFLYDLKCYSDYLHIKYTGVSNKIIKENLEKLSSISDIIVRIPIIPNVNTKEIIRMSEYLKGLNIKEIELLPYHSLGESKYKKLGIKFNKFEVPTDIEMKKYEEIFMCKK